VVAGNFSPQFPLDGSQPVAQTMTGTELADIIVGGLGHDQITGLAGNDQIDGQAGSDRIDGGDGNDSIAGGVGNDTLDGGLGSDTLLGEAGNDTLSDNHGNNLLAGGSGDDSLSSISLTGSQALLGGTGNDSLNAKGLVVSLDGGDGDDSLSASGRWPFDDSSYVNGGQASLVGGLGNDHLVASYESSAILDGGAGIDYLLSDNNRTAALAGGGGDDILLAYVNGLMSGFTDGDTGLSERALLDGGDGNDSLTVSFGTVSDVSFGLSDVKLIGGAGNDILTLNHDLAGGVSNLGQAYGVASGGLEGGLGEDVLTASGVLQLSMSGGAGADTFVLTAQQYRTMLGGTRTFTGVEGVTSNVNADPTVITDFEVGAGKDVLDVSDLLRNAAIGYDGSNPFSAGYLKLSQSGANTMVSFDVDGTAGLVQPPVTVAVLQNVVASTLLAANFKPMYDWNSVATGSVTISGIATQGQILTAANTLTDADGMGLVGYQWKADGTLIDGGTGPTLPLTQAQVGKAITVVAS
jgi:Ca2+-binding RTX toxin-like protein